MFSLSLKALIRKSTFLTRLPSTTYNRKDVKGQDVDMLFGKLNFQ
jgi:hypothetical protein